MAVGSSEVEPTTGVPTLNALQSDIGSVNETGGHRDHRRLDLSLPRRVHGLLLKSLDSSVEVGELVERLREQIPFGLWFTFPGDPIVLIFIKVGRASTHQSPLSPLQLDEALMEEPNLLGIGIRRVLDGGLLLWNASWSAIDIEHTSDIHGSYGSSRADKR